MKKYMLIVALLVFSASAWAASPSLEDLKKDRETKISKIKEIDQKHSKIMGQKQDLILEAQRVVGEIRYIDGLIKKYEKAEKDEDVVPSLDANGLDDGRVIPARGILTEASSGLSEKV